MELMREGASPLSSEAALSFVLRVLSRKDVAGTLLDAEAVVLAHKLVAFQPRHHLADTYLEQSLMGGAPRAFFTLDATEFHYLDHMTDGSWATRVGFCSCIDAMKNDWLVGVVADENDVHTFVWTDDSVPAARMAAKDAPFAQVRDATDKYAAPLLQEVSDLPLRVVVSGDKNHRRLVLAPERCDVRHRSEAMADKERLAKALAHHCSGDARLQSLVRLSGTCSVPCYSDECGFMEWVVAVGLGYVAIDLVEGHIADVRVGICISDRIFNFHGTLTKQTTTHQWHITDNCDQRCKHCYLFAEDARARCVSMSFDLLLQTLDEVEEDAARCHCLPALAITGGDPILHPRFWDFAQELHRRGVLWTAMGNPFHLNGEVCQRLGALGCRTYQMSLDGLEEFHDSLRRPGSYRATLEALEPLRAAGIRTMLMATASKQNLGDILACMDIAVEYGADAFVFARYCATSPEKAAELYPTPEEYRAFLLAYYQKARAYEEAGCKTTFKFKEHLFTLLRWELGEFRVPEWSIEDPRRVCDGCHLGVGATIAANGDLLACRRMESVVGNIRTDGLHAVDRGPAMQAYADVTNIKKCRDCELLNWCRGCRAVGFNATGDLQAADPMCWHLTS